MSGVGTMLKSLIGTLDIPEQPGCNCDELRERMDDLGVEGCRKQRETLIATLRHNAAHIQWLAKATAIGPAITSGLAFKVNPLDPIPGLFDEAVRLTELQEKH